jgi:catechol 2,3-dioxygenase-like lactoylglutathione lyase family enzyme
VHLTYAIVFVTDMPRSTAFYRDVMGLEVRFSSEHWTEFATGETVLALHDASGPATFQAAAGPMTAGHCRLGFRVPDLDGYHQAVTARGARCLEGPREEFGVRMALYADPDGLQLIVAEAAAEDRSV